jgi:hypothetical protein
VAGEEQPWGDTVWLTEMLNELRAEAGEPLAQHKNVLQAVRKEMEKLGEIGRLNFQPTTYTDRFGRSQPMIQFSNAVILNVGAVDRACTGTAAAGCIEAVLDVCGRRPHHDGG